MTAVFIINVTVLLWALMLLYLWRTSIWPLSDKFVLAIPTIIFYKRYIDDIFLVFKGDEQQLLATLQHLNTILNGISLTHNYSQSHVDFLDITIFKDYNKPANIDIRSPSYRFGYRTFQKQLNKYLYLPKQSIHPASTITGFIHGELLRYRKTNSNTSDFKKKPAIHSLHGYYNVDTISSFSRCAWTTSTYRLINWIQITSPSLRFCRSAYKHSERTTNQKACERSHLQQQRLQWHLSFSSSSMR